MVNALETLYVLTILSLMAAVIASLSGRALGARRFMLATLWCALAAVGLYVYLSP